MARKKQTPPTDPPVVLNEDEIQKDVDAMDANTQRLALIDNQYGDGDPYDYMRNIQLARHYLQQSADAMLEAGRRLILIKEHEDHGQFEFALAHIGIEPRAARKLMQAALKFSNRPTLADLGKSKMLELMVEDDDELDALEDGGTIAGLTLDEVDRMSVRELKESLRKAREEKEMQAESKDRLLADKSKKIDELAQEIDRLKGRKKIEPDEYSMELSQELNLHVEKAAAYFLAVRQTFDAILAFDKAPQHLKSMMAQSLDRIQVALADLRAAYPLDALTHNPEDDDFLATDDAREFLAAKNGSRS